MIAQGVLPFRYEASADSDAKALSTASRVLTIMSLLHTAAACPSSLPKATPVRMLQPELHHLGVSSPHPDSRLAQAWRRFDQATDSFIHNARLSP